MMMYTISEHFPVNNIMSASTQMCENYIKYVYVMYVWHPGLPQ